MEGRRVALLVATDRYEDTGLSRLKAPASDAKQLAAVLSDFRIVGFEVMSLYNEPHYIVGKAIGKFYKNRRHDDLTLLYFTGHGVKDEGGHLYLAMTDTDHENLQFTEAPCSRGYPPSRAIQRCDRQEPCSDDSQSTIAPTWHDTETGTSSVCLKCTVRCPSVTRCIKGRHDVPTSGAGRRVHHPDEKPIADGKSLVWASRRPRPSCRRAPAGRSFP